MKIELKNIRTNQRFSRETNCFTADVYVDGIKVGYAENDGNGGCTNVQPFSAATAEQFKKAEAWAKAQPKIKSEEFKFEYESNLEHVVDNLLEDYLDSKHMEKETNRLNKALVKDMLKNICYRTADMKAPNYAMCFWKGFTIEQILATEKGRTVLQNTVDKMKADGKTILNTNLKGITL